MNFIVLWTSEYRNEKLHSGVVHNFQMRSLLSCSALHLHLIVVGTNLLLKVDCTTGRGKLFVLIYHWIFIVCRENLFKRRTQRSWVRFPALPDFLRNSGSGTGSWGKLSSYLEEIVAAPVKKTETNDRGDRCADHATLSIRIIWHYFANKRRSLGRHSSLADQTHGVFFFFAYLNMITKYWREEPVLINL
jgi:hypothetical protein